MDQDFLDRLMARGLISPDVADRMSMTHEAEQPNPAQPYLDQAAQYGRTALGFAQGGLQGAGVPMPDWMRSNPVQRALQNPDINLALEAAFWKNPAMAARADDLIAKGYGRQAIADELGVGKASVGRYLEHSGQTTAAAENPSFWDDPANIEGLKQGVRQGLSHTEIAKKLGTTPGSVSGKLYKLINAGEELPGYQPRDPYFWESPERQERLKQLVGEGWSLRQMARDPQLGAPHAGRVSDWIKGMQERYGELKDWRPQYTSKTTPAGRAPTLSPVKSLSREAPPPDQDYVKALRDYLRGQGLTSLPMPQYG